MIPDGPFGGNTPNPLIARRLPPIEYPTRPNLLLIGQDRIYGEPGQTVTFDWPVPKGRSRWVALRSFTDNLQMSLCERGGGIAPLRPQREWPVPKGPRRLRVYEVGYYPTGFIIPAPPRPPPPPPPPPVGPVQQTLYALIYSNYQPAGIVPTLVTAQPLYVGTSAGRRVDAVPAVSVVALVFDIGPQLGLNSRITTANVALYETGGVDPTPGQRLSATTIIANGRNVQQILYQLVSGGQYVAVLNVRLNTGLTMTFSAPFSAA